MIDLDDPLGAEYDENEERKAFPPSERVNICEAIEALEQQRAKERQKQHGKTAPGKKKAITPGNLPEVSTGQTRDRTAAKVGWSGPTYEKANGVVKAADKDPNFVYLVEEMDQTGNVSAAYRQLPKTGQDLVFVEGFGAVFSAAVAIHPGLDVRCDVSGCSIIA